jgi:hypothetical protein
MVAMMRDVLLQCSGLVAIAAAVIHGMLGELKVFPRMSIEPQRRRALDGIGSRAALDRRHAGLRIRPLRAWQRLGHAGPALRLDGARRRGRDGGRGVLAQDPDKPAQHLMRAKTDFAKTIMLRT